MLWLVTKPLPRSVYTPSTSTSTRTHCALQESHVKRLTTPRRVDGYIAEVCSTSGVVRVRGRFLRRSHDQPHPPRKQKEDLTANKVFDFRSSSIPSTRFTPHHHPPCRTTKQSSRMTKTSLSPPPTARGRADTPKSTGDCEQTARSCS